MIDQHTTTPPRSRPRPKAVEPLSPELRAALRDRVERSSLRAAARDLDVSDSLVRRALDGVGLTRAIRRLLSLTILPTGAAQ